MKYIFSSTGRRPAGAGLLSWWFLRHTFHFYRSNWTKLAWSVYGNKISDVFHNERNPPSNCRVIGPEGLKITVFNLVSPVETTFLNQSGPKLHKLFIGTLSHEFNNDQNPSNMEVICPWIIENCCFEPCELDRDLISQSIWTKLAWSVYGHKI